LILRFLAAAYVILSDFLFRTKSTNSDFAYILVSI
jgi:hypothetical protein